MSSFVIQAADTNATLDNGIYICQVLLTISGENNFSMKSSNSTVAFKGMSIPTMLYNYIHIDIWIDDKYIHTHILFDSNDSSS